MKYWIGVASRDHVHKGVDGSFCQLCHGKSGPIRRISPGDWITYYSPRSEMRGGEPVQMFTAIGRVKDAEPYTVDMGGGFAPMRRDVEFLDAHPASVRPLIEQLAFMKDKRNWAYPFRFGVLKGPVFS
jgi:hypothetical protein